MIRVFITQGILFLLPFLVYAGYLFLTNKMHRKAWIDAPRYWLVLAGLGLSLAGFIVMSLVNNHSLDGTYIPAHEENGKVIPGQIKDAK
ncbi:DUF6111 family protein [uncultured Cohaesibacter sp.]|uniref:DUF6111 family protein n=1 Tax=uncultured Cohaesibacter sp. TaxID=1002546 RepID=UPI00292DD755|nr:DUF6111 family protein [uncultured Cohaesibacter sp.]